MKSEHSAAAPVPYELVFDALIRVGLIGPEAKLRLTPLAGGVASDIWKVETGERTFCVKRALPQLRVAARWEAPVERRRYEVAWLRTAAGIVPQAVPEVLGEDEEAGLFALTWFDPRDYRLWKEMLRDGDARPSDAAAAGAALGAIHSATADDPQIAAQFASDHVFHAIRLEPYLEAAAGSHPECARALHRLVRVTASTRRALVHGDVSPKNILIGPRGPVFLDAECAWYGDPAFDLAFCANHLLLKCLWTPPAADCFLACFEALCSSYLARVDWEPREAMEARAAHLLPGLFLARVDGKSPVEYVTADADREKVRRAAQRFLNEPVDRMAVIATAWKEEISR